MAADPSTAKDVFPGSQGQEALGPHAKCLAAPAHEGDEDNQNQNGPGGPRQVHRERLSSPRHKMVKTGQNLLGFERLTHKIFFFLGAYDSLAAKHVILRANKKLGLRGNSGAC